MLVAITRLKALRALPKRDPNAHKGSYGHVFILGGAPGMGGAIRLAGEGALRVGSGKVTLATAPEHAHVITLTRPELMCYPVQKPDELQGLNMLATLWVIGPGMGHSPMAGSLIEKILTFNKFCILDADALHWLSKNKQTRDNWILTPHPGEAAILLGCKVADIQKDRPAAVQKIQKQYGGTVVLKGAGTLICAPNTPLHICPAANPAMATPGMGDILGGMIAGLLAQGMSPLDAANLATIIHAEAADRACSGSRGLIASDIFPHISGLLNTKS
jgi:NAD(P)H-hydrate epimerase